MARQLFRGIRHTPGPTATESANYTTTTGLLIIGRISRSEALSKPQGRLATKEPLPDVHRDFDWGRAIPGFDIRRNRHLRGPNDSLRRRNQLCPRNTFANGLKSQHVPSTSGNPVAIRMNRSRTIGSAAPLISRRLRPSAHPRPLGLYCRPPNSSRTSTRRCDSVSACLLAFYRRVRDRHIGALSG